MGEKVCLAGDENDPVEQENLKMQERKERIAEGMFLSGEVRSDQKHKMGGIGLRWKYQQPSFITGETPSTWVWKDILFELL